MEFNYHNCGVGDAVARLVEEALGQPAPPGRVDAAGAVFEPPRGEFSEEGGEPRDFFRAGFGRFLGDRCHDPRYVGQGP